MVNAVRCGSTIMASAPIDRHSPPIWWQFHQTRHVRRVLPAPGCLDAHLVLSLYLQNNKVWDELEPWYGDNLYDCHYNDVLVDEPLETIGVK